MNVNVSYNGFSLADAASCVMMRLPVPDLVWDMEALWKVWNEPIPAITPEAVPESAPEPVRRRGGERFAAKPVAYAGKEYPSIAALAKAYHLGYKTCFARLRDGTPLEAPINRHPLPYRGKPVTIDGTEYPSTKDAAKALGIPYTTLFTRIRKGLPIVKKEERQEPDDVDEHSLREIRATPADEMKAWKKKWKACRFGGKKYTSLNALADLADVTLGQAYVGVEKMGKWIAEDEI